MTPDIQRQHVERFATLAKTAKLEGTFQIDLGGGLSSWTVDLKSGVVTPGAAPSDSKPPRVIVSLSFDDLLGVLDKKIDLGKAYVNGRIIVRGSMPLIMRLGAALKLT